MYCYSWCIDVSDAQFRSKHNISINIRRVKMFDIAKDLWDEAKSGDWMAVFFLLFLIVIAASIAFIAFHFVDSAGVKPETYKTYAVSRKHHQQYITTTTTNVNNVPVTTVTVHPERFTITVKHKEKEITCDVYEHHYKLFEQNKVVFANIASGRFTDNLYCKGFDYKDNRRGFY